MNNKEDENTPAGKISNSSDIRLEREPDSFSLRSPVLLLPSEISPVPEDLVQPSPCADQHCVSAEDPLPSLVSQHGGGGTSPFSPTFDSTSSFDTDVSHTDAQQCFDSGTNKMLKTKETSNPWQKKWVQNANVGENYESYPKSHESFPCNKLQPDVGVENRVQSCSRKRGRPRKHPIALKPKTPLSNELQCETVFLSDRECIDFDENDYDSTPYSMKVGNFYRKGSDASSQKSSLGTACTAFCNSSFKTTAQISNNVKVQIENLSAKKSVHDTFNHKHDEKQISSEGDKEAETVQKRKRGRPPKSATSVQKHDMKQTSYEVDKERETVQKRTRSRSSISNTLIQKHYIHLTSNELDKEAEIVHKRKKQRLPNSSTSFQKHDRKQTINDKETQIVGKKKRVQSFLVYASVQKHGMKQISNEANKESKKVQITTRERPPDTLILEHYVQQTNHEVDKEAETVQKKKRGRPPKKSIVNSGDNPVSHSQDSEEFSEVRSTKRQPSLKLSKCDLMCNKKVAGRGKRTIKKSKWSDDFVTEYNSSRTSAAPSNPMRPGFDQKHHRFQDHHCREKMSFHSDVSGNAIFTSVNLDSSQSDTSVNEISQPSQILNKSFQLSATLNESSQTNATLSESSETNATLNESSQTNATLSESSETNATLNESSQTNATLSHCASLGAAVNEPVLIKRKRGRPKKNAMPQPPVTSTPLCQSGHSRRRSVAENQKTILHQDSVSDEEQNTSKQKGDNTDFKNKIERCLRCDEEMDTLYHYKQHLMTRHAAWYTSKTPAGEENGMALRAIIKQLGKVCCPKCQKPFKHHQYFQYHLLWCGREGEQQTCGICGRTVKAMWFHMHERSHQLKEMKIEKELDSDNHADVAEGKSDKRVRRKAAKIALESLKDMTETELENENGERRKTKRVEHEEWNAGSCEESDNDFHELDSDQEQKRRPLTGSTARSPSINLQRPGTDFFAEYMKLAQSMAKESLFDNLHPRAEDWIVLPERNSANYYPSEVESIPFRIQTQRDTSEQTKLKWGEACCDKEQATGYVGGSVWALEWCPLGHATVNRQVLAVASSKDVCWGPALSRISDGPCSIQFWDAGSLDGRESPSVINLSLAFTLVHDFGHVVSMSWCPRGCFGAEKPLDSNYLSRLGLLVVACSDGLARIYSIPTMDAVSQATETTFHDTGVSTSPIFKPPPVITLTSCNAAGSGPCLSVSWQKGGNCEFIAGGFGKGIVHVWHLNTNSSLLQPSSGVLYPVHSFHGHQSAVMGIDWSLTTPTQFATGGWDKYIKFWDLLQPKMPVFSLPGRGKFTPPHTIPFNDLCAALSKKKNTRFGHVRSVVLGSSASSALIHSSDPFTKKIVVECSGLDLANGPSEDFEGVCRHAANVFDISYSDWYNVLVSGGSSGTAQLSTCLPIFHPHNKQFIKKRCGWKLFTVVAEDLKQDKEVMSSQSAPWQPKTKEEVTQNLCIKFIDRSCLNKQNFMQPGLESSIMKDSLGGFPFQDVTRVSINPNLLSSHWVAAGTKVGFLRVLHVPLLPQLFQSSTSFFSKHGSR